MKEDWVIIGSYFFSELALPAKKKGWACMTYLSVKRKTDSHPFVESCRHLFGEPIEIYGDLMPYFPDHGNWIILSYRRNITVYLRSLDQAKEAVMYTKLSEVHE